MDELLIPTSDGRVLEVATLGSPGGATVFFHHGTPGSKYSFSMLAPLAASGEFFLVSSSRAGYGSSDRKRGRDVADVVADTHDVLDALGRDRYLSVGWSGGGPHALACAALGAPRCRAAWSLAGVAPINVGFDWTEGMGPENVAEFERAQIGGEAHEAAIAEIAEVFAEANQENVIRLFGGLLSNVDKAVLGDEPTRRTFARAIRQAFARGDGGYFDDDHAFMNAWGFSVSDVTIPVEIWFGDDDLMVPASHGRWLVANLPGARERYFAREGHVSLIVNHLDELARSWRTHLSMVAP
ncbi:MAG TPA: alpha/beta fold hydrolase [Acidimicrobiales bacterium]|nr:alpha/beta fold hydrolase [Acidimicrobiales bacterium]